MAESSITMTSGKDWWLMRTTSGGRMRYPERIRVGSSKEPIVYVPERTCRVVVSHGDHGPEPRFPGDAWTARRVCSECGAGIDAGIDAFCRRCGARVVAE